jgi:rhodanese-related sulfurtransferase
MTEEDTPADTPASDVTVDPTEALRRSEAGEATLVDVRTDHEWAAGRVAGATHVELNDLTAAADSLGDGGPLVFYCRGGRRSEMAAQAFREAGRDAHSMDGGLLAWQEAGLPIDPEDGYIAESGDAAAILEARKRVA